MVTGHLVWCDQTRWECCMPWLWWWSCAWLSGAAHGWCWGRRSGRSSARTPSPGRLSSWRHTWRTRSASMSRYRQRTSYCTLGKHSLIYSVLEWSQHLWSDSCGRGGPGDHWVCDHSAAQWWDLHHRVPPTEERPRPAHEHDTLPRPQLSTAGRWQAHSSHQRACPHTSLNLRSGDENILMVCIASLLLSSFICRLSK